MTNKKDIMDRKIKTSPGADAGISMERIATIAVDAILETLKKETL
ncbi:hypothetical protein SAMN02746065_12719 [Desulfocicer vacuolatum DSM 3385]|uniref:Uncharacterized protein n=1 Tax=Desulfocicer vacuolatum DSM 3385 TaxID=1121400 RepID=A0A1W2EA89_9BACT|nr:hypothetical protein [Desulfocicer vacuolatum]SMD06342.1 hypothetical protein SAMN02746065_12719 [Desulfocicer vacuolatum DSM 3385]